MAQRSVKVGNIKDVSGEINIAAGDIDIYKGYTARQVSILLKQITTTFQPKKFDGHCPYKGLDAFEEEDSDLFFGREQLIGDLVKHVQVSRTVFVIGPSGSGKSSLMRAGLIYSLKQGAIKNRHSERWIYETINPGPEPIEALALALSRVKSPELGNYFRQHAKQAKTLYQCAETTLTNRKDQRFVLMIDQFEEIFTQVSDDKKRSLFLNLLTYVATIESGRMILLFAMRSDFVPNLAMYPQLNALFNQQSVQIGAMQPDELVSAIAQPALRVGLRVDPDLIAQIINDMQGEPGALPLMQFTLKDLFDTEEATGRLTALRLDDYLQRGGIRKSLERHADTVFAELSAKEQELAYSIFGSLIEIGRGTQDTRRIAKFEELVPADTQVADVQTLVRKLTDARLITTDEAAGKYTATISHEKLIDAWPWLKKLVNENRETIALQNDIASDAQEWDENKRDPSYLYRGARLITAREQLGSKKLALSGLAQDFVQAGSARQRRSQIGWIMSISLVILLLSLAVVRISHQSSENANLADQNAKIAGSAQAASTDAVSQRETADANAELAQKQTKIVLARQLAEKAQSLLDSGSSNQQTAVLLAIEALHFAPIDTATRILEENKLAKPVSQMDHADSIEAAIFSPDSKYVASASDDHTARVWEVETGKEISRMTYTNDVYSVAFSPDGKSVASASVDGTVRVWESDTGKLISQVQYGSAAYQATFSADGEYVASRGCDQKDVADHCTQYSARVWQAQTAREVIRIEYEYSGGSIIFSPDGESVAFGECVQHNDGGFCTHGSVRVLETRTGKEISRISTDRGLETFEFSPDGIFIVSTGCALFDEGNECKQGSIQVWDTATGREIAYMNQGTWIGSFAFSPDSKYLVTGSQDGTTALWEVATGQEIATLATAAYIESVAFSPDGQYVASSGCLDRLGFLRFACARGFAQVWELATRTKVSSATYNTEVSSVNFSPDSQYVLWVGGGGTEVWDIATGQEIVQLPDWTNFSPDGHYMISTTDDHIRVWSLDTGNEIKHIPAVTGMMTNLSADGKYVAFGECHPSNSASACPQGSIQVWNVALGKQIATVAFVGKVSVMAFSPDDNYLLLGGCEEQDSQGQCLQGAARVMEVKTAKEISHMTYTREVTAAAFSPDGKMVASGGCDQTNPGGYSCKQASVRVWESATGKEICRIPYDGEITSIAFSPDGVQIVSSVGYGVTAVSETTTGKEISHLNADGQSLIFSPDGKYLLAFGNDAGADVWNPITGEKIVAIDHSGLGPSSPVLSAAFSPDGKYVLSGGGDGIASLWELATGKGINSQSQSLNPSGSAISLAFSPDGKYIVSGNSEGILHIWDSGLVNEIAQMTQRDPVQSVRFSVDGRYIISTSETAIRVWGFQPDDLIAEACTRVTSNLTHDEWLQYFGDTLPYQAVCPNLPLNFDYIEEIARNALSKSDDPTRVTTALDQMQAELQKIESITDPNGEALHILSPILLDQIETEVNQKVNDQTLTFLDQAGKINIQITVKDQGTLQHICRKGSLNGYAASVLAYCDSAINLDPNDLKSHDYRGIARAVSGDYSGAILDFQYFVDHSQQSELVVQRQQWIELLKGNNNPFTSEVLAVLKQPPATPTSQVVSPTPTLIPISSHSTPTPTPWAMPTVLHLALPCSTGTIAPSSNLININLASACELEVLPGIGPTLAHNIVSYREQNGPFVSIEDIQNVSGIGPAIFELLKDLITVSG